MIPLVLVAEVRGISAPLIIRVAGDGDPKQDDATIARTDEKSVVISRGSLRVRISGNDPSIFFGDVLLVDPQRSLIHRLIRASSRHNTFLVTERCDQLCVMCSQPPKKTHNDMFGHFEAAARLAPRGATIGISGGEPTLYKESIFQLIENTWLVRPDVRFHVLTNAQHFADTDSTFLSSDAAKSVVWGVPLYAADAPLHDHIVGKMGAFESLRQGLSVLCRSGSQVELRTVIMGSNAGELARLAEFVASNVPFANPWAIMQLERIGYAANRWDELFFDNSADFSTVGAAVDIARVHGVPTLLYNFPLCTVPEPYRPLAPQTISDWKSKYLPGCEGCSLRESCGGFFEWHQERSYARIGLQ